MHQRPASASASRPGPPLATAGRRARPQSAAARRDEEDAAGRNYLAAGGGTAAVRSRRRPRKAKRPQTAPVRGKRGGRDGDADDWRAALARNGLLDEPLGSERKTPPPASVKYLHEEARRRREADDRLLADTRREQEQYEKACVQRMGEASRFAQYLGLRKKYNPIHIRVDETEGAPGSIGRVYGFVGELRCEIVAKEDSHSRIISCSLFDREYERLLSAYRRKRKADEGASSASAALALATATSNMLAVSTSPTSGGASPSASLSGKLRRASVAQPDGSMKRRASRKALFSSAKDEGFVGFRSGHELVPQGVIAGSDVNRRRRSLVSGGAFGGGDGARLELEAGRYSSARTEVDEITRELTAVIEETLRLDSYLREQQRVLTENGWNLRIPSNQRRSK